MTTQFNKEIVFYVFILSFLMAISISSSVQAEGSTVGSRRIALVVGNASYPQYPLKNPLNDARGMATVLKKSHFEVTLLENAGRRKMNEAISAFGKRLYNVDVGLFYFAGHGVQFEGSNYLIPVDAVINDEVDVKYEAVNASRILDKMKQAKNDVNIVILDACRNNPFAGRDRSAGGSVSRGLTKMFSPVGSFVAYATAPGSVSADGNGKHGIYTKYLLKYIQKPGLTIEQVFKKVRKAVRHDTGQQQTPWENSSLMGDFYFIQAESVTIKPAPVPKKPLTGSILIKTEPDKAKIWIDDGYEGRSPLEIPSLTPGLIVVKVGKAGFQSQQEKVKIRAGRRSVLTLQLPEKKQLTGRLTVLPDPSDALITLLNTETVYRKGMELNAGFHKIEVSRKEYDTAVLSVEVVAGKNTDVRIILKKNKEEAARKAEEALALAQLHAQLQKQQQEEEALRRKNKEMQAELAREQKKKIERARQIKEQQEEKARLQQEKLAAAKQEKLAAAKQEKIAAARVLEKRKEEERARLAREGQEQKRRHVQNEQQTKQGKEQKIVQLLQQSNLQIREYRLASPPGNNAVETLRKIFFISPDDQRVYSNLSEVVAAYRRLGKKESERGKFDKAEQRFQQGKKIAEEFNLPRKEIDSLDLLIAGLVKKKVEKTRQERKYLREQEEREKLANQQRRDRQLKKQRGKDASKKATQSEYEDVQPVKKSRKRRVIGIF